MTQDRLGHRKVPMTHEFLSVMLGVRRAGVTEALHALEGKRAIRAMRGEIAILDRKIIEKRAGALYGLPEAEYERLIPGQVRAASGDRFPTRPLRLAPATPIHREAAR